VTLNRQQLFYSDYTGQPVSWQPQLKHWRNLLPTCLCIWQKCAKYLTRYITTCYYTVRKCKRVV